MKLYEVTNARIFAGGGTRKYLLQTSSKRRTNVVLLSMKGGVKLDSIRHRDRL